MPRKADASLTRLSGATRDWPSHFIHLQILLGRVLVPVAPADSFLPDRYSALGTILSFGRPSKNLPEGHFRPRYTGAAAPSP
jgi:hypothetical protein